MAKFHTQLEVELRVALEDERVRLRRSLDWLGQAEQASGESQADESSAGGQQADIATDVADQTMDATFEQSERRRLVEVEDALRRIAEGGFGACEACGQAIDPARLIAVPWTRLCLSCAVRRQHALARPR